MFSTFDRSHIEGKRVIVRGDLDVDIHNRVVVDNARISAVSDCIKTILSYNPSKVIIIGHRGRPKGINSKLSLEYMGSYFATTLRTAVTYIPHSPMHVISQRALALPDTVILVENLRFWAEEETNDPLFAQALKDCADVYVNEAFAASHRKHTSIDELPRLFNGSAYAGPRFIQEVEQLSRVRENPDRPCIAIISGVKEDKLTYVGAFKSFCDRVLIGGRLPEYLGDTEPDAKTVVARLNPDKEDITIHSIELFEEEVGKAKTIIVSGPIGKYEDEGHRLGTQRIFRAVASSDAFKLAGGGNTEEALNSLGFAADFDWVSIGGGAMLEYLANGTLPGIEALNSSGSR